MSNNNKDIAWRIYLVYFFCCLLGIAVISKVIWIQWVEGEGLREKSEKMTIANKTIKAVRGNVYASDGSLLATSVPKYELRFDVNADAITDKFFYENLDSLCIRLSQLLKNKSSEEYRQELIAARNSITKSGKKGGRYHLIGRNISYRGLKEIKRFPLFRKGRYKGGFIYIQRNKREKPFRFLAERTIGYKRSDVSVGLEGAYNAELQGVDGKRLMQKIAGGNWKPLNDENEIEPKNGFDLNTTIDINLQDVAENALLKQLSMHGADHGCVVLMEVKTGEIKAIANLKRNEFAGYYEGYNYAIGESTEPGSTFKLACLIAALEDGFIELDTEIDTEHGKKKFYDQTMYDTHDHGVITVKRAFEVSSNIAVAKIISENYSNDPQRFINHLHRMNLNNKLNLEIKGEGMPKIKGPKSEDWSGVSLPWMAHGYEVLMTPMQILTFYNAIANNGVMVKPKFVTSITSKGKVVREIPTEIINESVCSKETLEKVQSMLDGVVNNQGTAANLKNAHFHVAGKTGTAQIANAQYGYEYELKTSYQASFVGYFPAENPKYSCIVVVNAPTRNVYTGNLVAGPIFKEVADKVYANSLKMHEALAERDHKAPSPLPFSKNGNRNDMYKVFTQLNVPFVELEESSIWMKTSTKDTIVETEAIRFIPGLIPNVVGMGLRDAIYLLENNGLVVRFSGKGIIKKQSIMPGKKVIKGQTIKLELV